MPNKIETKTSTLAQNPEWLDEKPPPQPILLRCAAGQRDFLPLGKVGMVAAPGGVGKSHFLIQLAICVSTGRCLYGTYQVTGPGPVYLAAAEEDPGDLRRRIYYAADMAKLTKAEKDKLKENLYIGSFYGENDCAFISTRGSKGQVIHETLFCREFLSYLEEADKQWRLVVLDPASRFGGTEMEISAAAATAFVATLEKITLTKGTPSVLFAHHTNKTSRQNGRTDATAARGSAALTDGVRWQANMETTPHPSGITLRHVKTNNTPLAPKADLWHDPYYGGALRIPTAVEREDIERARREEEEEQRKKRKK
jgi:RecA-family ATPase